MLSWFCAANERLQIQGAVPGCAGPSRSRRLIITKHGKPVARLIPAYSECRELIGTLKDQIQIHGDILSAGIEWDAQS
jgi:hypothetical protein